MKHYRLMIYQHDRLLGHFDSDLPWSREAVAQMVAHLQPVAGMRLELLEAHDERRAVESSPQGVRLLYSVPIFRPVPLVLPCHQAPD
ncbi:cytoplasmic protein [uncultured Herbaspirillum sp.]|uniref:cytoplasmic protein n=1 Tax=uncultured Herbaspirillum sp. TaxID=160236 RepID=UPI00260AE4AE|nr:cytoplasmic protein [uncultured Herbaspirillum sp.]